MATISRLSWLFLGLIVLGLALAAVSPVLADEGSSLGEKVEETKEATKDKQKSWMDWGKERFGAAQKQTSEVTGKGQEAAKQYATQGSQKIQESAGGLYKKWSGWARDTVGKYGSGKPAKKVTEDVDQEATHAEAEL